MQHSISSLIYAFKFLFILCTTTSHQLILLSLYRTPDLVPFNQIQLVPQKIQLKVYFKFATLLRIRVVLWGKRRRSTKQSQTRFTCGFITLLIISHLSLLYYLHFLINYFHLIDNLSSITPYLNTITVVTTENPLTY